LFSAEKLKGREVPMEHQLAGASELGEGGQRVRRIAAVVHEVNLVARVPREPPDAPDAGLHQRPGVAGRHDEADPRRGRGQAVAHVMEAGGEARGHLGLDSGPLQMARERRPLSVLVHGLARLEGREDHRQAEDAP
jgi:hypothetical protein